MNNTINQEKIDKILKNSKVFLIDKSSKYTGFSDKGCLIIKGSLKIDSNETIKKLPKSMIILKDLIITYGIIEEIPESITVFGDVIVQLSAIKKIPNADFRGNIDASFSDVTAVEKKEINGNLDLRGTDIKEIKNLTVNGELNISSSLIRRLGNTVLAKSIVAADMDEFILESKIYCNMDVSYCEKLTMPFKLEVKGDFDMRHCKVIEYSDEVKIDGKFLTSEMTNKKNGIYTFL